MTLSALEMAKTMQMQKSFSGFASSQSIPIPGGQSQQQQRRKREYEALACKYTVEDAVGRGVSGTVLAGFQKDDDKQVAIKVIKKVR